MTRFLTLWLAATGVQTPSDDVSFMVMGKIANRRQSENGQIELLNYHFFAEIFVKNGGKVTESSLLFPDRRRQDFTDQGYVQELHGGRYQSEAELDAAYPNGDYRIEFRTGGGRVDRTLAVKGGSGGASRLPSPVQIQLLQGGEQVSVDAVDPSRDLVVSWTTFGSAGKDANGIVDDLIFVVVGNCRGEQIVHSGRPFAGTPYLSYDATAFTIPADTLAAGEPHQMYVEHAIVDTGQSEGIVDLVTYASNTFLDFQAAGLPSGKPCPEPMPKMDGGQTDRPDRKEPEASP